MATEFSLLGIVNAALMAQGQEEVSENDGSLEWRTLIRNWPMIVEAELEDGNYSFTKQEANLITRSDGKFGFDDAYLVPHDALHVRHLWLKLSTGERVTTDWVQDGSYVYLDSPDGCWIEYINVSNTDLWSANFSIGVQKKLEAVILRAVKEEFGEAENLEQRAEYHFGRARVHSSKSRSPTPVYKKGPIARARRNSVR